jgi:hypothetical protein
MKHAAETSTSDEDDIELDIDLDFKVEFEGSMVEVQLREVGRPSTLHFSSMSTNIEEGRRGSKWVRRWSYFVELHRR